MKNLSLPELKINSRDKQLVVLLGLVVLAFLCYYFIISPAWDKNTSNRSESAALKMELEAINTTIANLNQLKSENRIEKLRLVEKYKSFFSELRDDRILYQMDNLMASAGFQIDSYSPSGKAVSQIQVPMVEFTPLTSPLSELSKVINPLVINPWESGNNNPIPVDVAQATAEAPAEAPANAEAQTPTDSVFTEDLSLSFSGANYSNIMAFVLNLEKMDKAIIVKSINLAKASATTGLDGNIVVGLYSIPKLNDSENDYLKYLPQIPRGKTNPFV